MRLRLSAIVLLFAGLGVAGCGRPASSEPPKNVPPPLRRVVFQSDWFPQAEHGGYYQALAKGFYREAGLAVEIRPGGNAAGIKLPVATGEADFGLSRSDDVMVAASRGLPLVMVADRKSTRLNSSHRCISYAVFCLKK